MTGRPLDRWGFDPLTAAVGLALLTGVVSLAVTGIQPLVVALAGISVAAWALRSGSPGAVGRGGPGRAGSLALLGVGWVVYLVAPPPLLAVRGLLLALTLVPLTRPSRSHPQSGAVRGVL